MYGTLVSLSIWQLLNNQKFVAIWNPKFYAVHYTLTFVTCSEEGDI